MGSVVVECGAVQLWSESACMLAIDDRCWPNSQFRGAAEAVNWEDLRCDDVAGLLLLLPS